MISPLEKQIYQQEKSSWLKQSGNKIAKSGIISKIMEYVKPLLQAASAIFGFIGTYGLIKGTVRWNNYCSEPITYECEDAFVNLDGGVRGILCSISFFYLAYRCSKLIVEHND